MKNKYSNYSRISEGKFREVLKCFSLDLTSSNTAKLTGISRNTINSLFNKFRIHIFENCISISASKGEFELDESYFGAKRVRERQTRAWGSRKDASIWFA